MGEVIIRIITILGCSAFVLSLALYNLLTYCLFFLTIHAMCSYEYFKVTKLGVISYINHMVIYALMVINVFELGNIWIYAIPLMYLQFLMVFQTSNLVCNCETENIDNFRRLTTFVFGFFFISVPCLMGVDIMVQTGEPLIMIGTMMLIWFSDGGAYAFGRIFGKTPLMPKISPKKTVEGFFGGALLSACVLPIVIGFDVLELYQWIVIYFISVIGGAAGDLIESVLKRSTKTKDTGSILPGHGGVLDRCDALLYVLPFVWWFLNTN